MTAHWLTLIFAALTLRAEDPLQTALAVRAQADFERVEQASRVDLASAAACAQSQTAVLPVTAPESQSMIHYRRGHCQLAGALAAQDRRGFEDAARSFEQAIAAWPNRLKNKKAPPEPVSAGLGAFRAIARLLAGADAAEWPELDRRLDEARRSAACPAVVMSAELCRRVLLQAGAWRGWIAVRQGRTAAAELAFAAAPAPGWGEWLAGTRAFENRRYRESADSFRRALDAWSAVRNRAATIPEGLAPPGDPSAARIDLAGSLIAAGDARAALPLLEAAVKQPPVRAWTYFLRGRAREETGAAEAATSDYNMAARIALAGADDATGEARFYRGVWLYRRGEIPRAEEEFIAALNAGLGRAPGKADATAWRALAAVTAGACDATREKLAAATGPASPFFPFAEAKEAIARCAGQPRIVSEAR